LKANENDGMNRMFDAFQLLYFTLLIVHFWDVKLVEYHVIYCDLLCLSLMGVLNWPALLFVMS